MRSWRMANVWAVLYPLWMNVSLDETKRNNEWTIYQSPVDDLESPLAVYQSSETSVQKRIDRGESEPARVHSRYPNRHSRSSSPAPKQKPSRKRLLNWTMESPMRRNCGYLLPAMAWVCSRRFLWRFTPRNCVEKLWWNGEVQGVLLEPCPGPPFPSLPYTQAWNNAAPADSLVATTTSNQIFLSVLQLSFILTISNTDFMEVELVEEKYIAFLDQTQDSMKVQRNGVVVLK